MLDGVAKDAKGFSALLLLIAISRRLMPHCES